MAGIDKICEVCDDYVGSDMYTMSSNLFQVCNKCKPSFRGHSAVIYMDAPDRHLDMGIGYVSHSIEDEEWFKDSGRKIPRGKLVNRYEYAIEIKGDTYWHYTYDKKTMLRKVKRLTRSSDIRIHENVYMEAIYREYSTSQHGEVYEYF